MESHRRSENPRQVWAGRVLRAPLISSPAMGRDSFHPPMFLQALENFPWLFAMDYFGCLGILIIQQHSNMCWAAVLCKERLWLTEDERS